MLVQEYIPGPASNQASFNVYCDKTGKVRMMVYGQILLADPLPLRIGNNDAIYTKYMPELFDFYKEKLESIGYTGYSNIDLKYEIDDSTVYQKALYNALDKLKTFKGYSIRSIKEIKDDSDYYDIPVKLTRNIIVEAGIER